MLPFNHNLIFRILPSKINRFNLPLSPNILVVLLSCQVIRFDSHAVRVDFRVNSFSWGVYHQTAVLNFQTELLEIILKGAEKLHCSSSRFWNVNYIVDYIDWYRFIAKRLCVFLNLKICHLLVISKICRKKRFFLNVIQTRNRTNSLQRRFLCFSRCDSGSSSHSVCRDRRRIRRILKTCYFFLFSNMNVYQFQCSTFYSKFRFCLFAQSLILWCHVCLLICMSG